MLEIVWGLPFLFLFSLGGYHCDLLKLDTFTFIALLDRDAQWHSELVAMLPFGKNILGLLA